MRVNAELFLLCTLCIFPAAESAPAFTEEPLDQSAREGNNITLEWRYNFGGGSFRQLLFGNTDVTIVDKYADDKVPYIAPAYRGRLQANVTDTYTSITFLRVNRTDTTTYTLEIIDKSTREMAKSQVEISVEYPPEITVHPEAETKTEGDDVALSCDVTGNPEPTISWTRNESPIETSNNSRISFSGDKKQFTIRNVNRADSGKYRCVASNTLGNATSNAASLNVQYKPEITAHPKNKTKLEGENVTLTCNATGNPVPTIPWTMKGSSLDTNDNFTRISFSYDKNQLTITNVNRTDSGECRCVEINSLGSATSNTASLDVQ